MSQILRKSKQKSFLVSASFLLTLTNDFKYRLASDNNLYRGLKVVGTCKLVSRRQLSYRLKVTDATLSKLIRSLLASKPIIVKGRIRDEILADFVKSKHSWKTSLTAGLDPFYALYKNATAKNSPVVGTVFDRSWYSEIRTTDPTFRKYILSKLKGIKAKIAKERKTIAAIPRKNTIQVSKKTLEVLVTVFKRVGHTIKTGEKYLRIYKGKSLVAAVTKTRLGFEIKPLNAKFKTIISRLMKSETMLKYKERHGEYGI